MNKLFHLVDESCDRRKGEVSYIENTLIENGLIKTKNMKHSDLIVFFTCAFCKRRVNDMTAEIVRIKKLIKNGSVLVVGGCLPKTDKESLAKVFQGVTVSPTDFSGFNNIPNFKLKIDEPKKFLSAKSYSRLSKNELFRQLMYFLQNRGFTQTLKKLFHYIYSKDFDVQIVRGCHRRCTYCAIKLAIGPLRSKPLEEAKQEINKRIKEGYKRFNLKGDCIGDYGLNINIDLGCLLRELSIMGGNFSIGIFDIRPESFLEFFSEIQTLCKMQRLHTISVAIQSGNARILKLMNRRVDPSIVKNKILEIKKYTKLELLTSIIIGFPSETEEEFEDTLNFLKDVRFDLCNVHIYSDMPSTPSSKLPAKIDKEVLLRRYKRIIESKIIHNPQETELELKSL